MTRDTEQRRAIRLVFNKIPRPLSVQEVLEAAQEYVPGIGIATVYRNLKSLVKTQWLQTVNLPAESARYERADIGHHHHFHCRLCDRVFDIEACPGNLNSLTPPGFEVESHEILFYGQCKECGSTTEHSV